MQVKIYYMVTDTTSFNETRNVWKCLEISSAIAVEVMRSSKSNLESR